jgi:hypothetical protein
MSINQSEADSLASRGAVLWGTNCRLRGSRTREVLGWKPVEKALAEEIPETFRMEAWRLGLSSRP